jgi:hypothetical protein
VLLTEGVGKIERASAFRPYTELSYLARPVAVTVDGQPIRSRHGLTFAPRAELGAAAPELDRLVVAGADAARRAAADRLPLPERLTPVHLHDRPGFAFDGALRDIARTYDVTTARWVAKTLQYPTTDPELSGPAWPWALTLKVIPPVAVSAPGRSNLRSASRAWSASISTNAPMSAAPASGTLTKNTASQPRERVSTPPSKTPTTRPAAPQPPQTPRARLRSRPSANVMLISARVPGKTKAPPRP